MRWTQDHTDILCSDWAKIRRRTYGIVLAKMIEPRELLGKLRCTIGIVREEGEGASQGIISQNFPEVYTGDALMVHRCWLGFSDDLKLTMEAQYVFREIPVKMKAAELQFTVTDYWRNLKQVKCGVANYLKGRTDERNGLDRVDTQKSVSTQLSQRNTDNRLQHA